jgi:hypothetical protein
MVNFKIDNDNGFVPETFSNTPTQSDYQVAANVGTITDHDTNPFLILETTFIDYMEEVSGSSCTSMDMKSTTKPVLPKEKLRAWHPDEIDHGTLEYILKDYISTRKTSEIESWATVSLHKDSRVSKVLVYASSEKSIRYVKKYIDFHLMSN